MVSRGQIERRAVGRGVRIPPTAEYSVSREPSTHPTKRYALHYTSRAIASTPTRSFGAFICYHSFLGYHLGIRFFYLKVSRGKNLTLRRRARSVAARGFLCKYRSAIIYRSIHLLAGQYSIKDGMLHSAKRRNIAYRALIAHIPPTRNASHYLTAR